MLLPRSCPGIVRRHIYIFQSHRKVHGVNQLLILLLVFSFEELLSYFGLGYVPSDLGSRHLCLIYLLTARNHFYLIHLPTLVYLVGLVRLLQNLQQHVFQILQ